MSTLACSVTCKNGISGTRQQIDQAVQVSVTTFVPSVERMKWRRKERNLKAQIRRLRETVDKFKQELEKLKEECHVPAFRHIREKANKKDVQASFLLEQIKIFRR